jgi:hypothetical protein
VRLARVAGESLQVKALCKIMQSGTPAAPAAGDTTKFPELFAGQLPAAFEVACPDSRPRHRAVCASFMEDRLDE